MTATLVAMLIVDQWASGAGQSAGEAHASQVILIHAAGNLSIACCQPYSMPMGIRVFLSVSGCHVLHITYLSIDALLSTDSTVL